MFATESHVDAKGTAEAALGLVQSSYHMADVKASLASAAATARSAEHAIARCVLLDWWGTHLGSMLGLGDLEGHLY